MEFFRWILVITGIVLLGVAWFMGRSKSGNRAPRQSRAHARDHSLQKPPVIGRDPIAADRPAVDNRQNRQNRYSDSPVSEDAHWQESDPTYGVAGSHVDDKHLTAPTDGQETVFEGSHHEWDFDHPGAGPEGHTVSASADQPDQQNADQENADHGSVTSFASAVKAVNAQAAPASTSTRIDSEVDLPVDWQVDATEENTPDNDNHHFSEEFQTYDESHHEPVELDEFEEKLVSVHVVALTGRRFYGKDLKALFDQHGYTFGRMSLYHCALDGDKVFSVANMVKPGIFQEDKMASFETPGITLFMRLPIELDSDVAFDFLIREAKELAQELGGQLRDSSRNPLSEQTIQHMREDIQQYVFRSKQLMLPTT